MVAEHRLTKGETSIEDSILNNKKETEENNTVILHVHMIDNNTIGMMGKMNIKLPAPTQFDGNNPQFKKWAGEVQAYLTLHNVHFKDYTDNGTSSIDVVNIFEIQDDYTSEDYIKLNNKSPAISAEDTDEYEDYNEMMMYIRKKKDDIASFSLTLNYVLVHSTKLMRQSSGFEAWRQLTLHCAGGHRAQTSFSPSHDHATQLGCRSQTIHSTMLQVAGRHY
eukprot:1045230-Amphidinium_carterae.1